MSDILLILPVALLMGVLLQRIHLPGGMMLGALFAVAGYNILLGDMVVSVWVKVLAQIMAGIFVGAGVRREDVVEMPRLAKPIVVLLTTFTLFSISMGVILPLVSDMDTITAMMCSVPGGLSDTPVIAADFGADVPTVAVLQFFRMLSGIAFFPIMTTTFVRHFVQDGVGAEVTPVEKAAVPLATGRQMALMIAVGGLAGLFGAWVDIPAGGLVLSMVTIIALKMGGLNCRLPNWFRLGAQVLSGLYIGTTFTVEHIFTLKTLLLPTCVVLGGYMAISIGMGYLFRHLWGMNQAECMLACTPAGAADMALIASDLGVGSADLVIIQVVRFLFAVGVLPQILLLVTAVVV